MGFYTVVWAQCDVCDMKRVAPEGSPEIMAERLRAERWRVRRNPDEPTHYVVICPACLAKEVPHA